MGGGRTTSYAEPSPNPLLPFRHFSSAASRTRLTRIVHLVCLCVKQVIFGYVTLILYIQIKLQKCPRSAFRGSLPGSCGFKIILMIL